MHDSHVGVFLFLFFGGVGWLLKGEKRVTELAQSVKDLCAKKHVWHFCMGSHFVCMRRYLFGDFGILGFSYCGFIFIDSISFMDISRCENCMYAC